MLTKKTSCLLFLSSKLILRDSQLLREFPDNPRVELVLGDLDPGMERLGGIAVQQGDAALAENLARIDSGID